MRSRQLLLTLSLIFAGFSGTSVAKETITAVGPVKKSSDSTHVRILGGNFAVPIDAVVYVNGERKYDARAALGEIANLYGVTVIAVADSPAGVANSFFVDTSGRYVPGRSEVTVSGPIEFINSRLGKISVRGVLIDYTNILSGAPETQLRQGEVVTVAGTQPSEGGVLLATKLAKGGISGSGAVVGDNALLSAGISGSGITPTRKSASTLPRSGDGFDKGISGSGLIPHTPTK